MELQLIPNKVILNEYFQFRQHKAAYRLSSTSCIQFFWNIPFIVREARDAVLLAARPRIIKIECKKKNVSKITLTLCGSSLPLVRRFFEYKINAEKKIIHFVTVGVRNTSSRQDTWHIHVRVASCEYVAFQCQLRQHGA